MRLGLTYDLQTDPADERQAEFDPPGTMDALETALRTLGYHVTRLGNAAQLPAAPVPPFPVIVKPRYEGSGLGIDPGAVVCDPDALQCRVAWVIDRFRQPCLIESFIPFAELTVFLIGNRPPMAFPAIQRPLDPVSRLSCHVARAAGSGWFCPAELTPDVDREAQRIAVGVFDALRCRDWARVDLRLDAEGRCYFLEINPLPSVDPRSEE